MLTNNQPLVSVIALCYNQEKFLEETLESIKNQSYKNIQLIIIDDASKDNSVQCIQNWIKTNEIDCTFVAHPANLGLCKTINDGLSHVKGVYYQAIACDDLMFPTKIEEQVALFQASDDNLAVVYSDAVVINENSVETFASFEQAWNYPSHVPDDFFKALIERNFIIAPSVLVKKAAVDTVGVYDESLCFEDWDMWLRLSNKKYTFSKSPRPLVKYRFYGSSMSQGKTYKSVMARDCIKILDKYLGKSKEIDNLIIEAQRPNITALIEHNDATVGILWKKATREKTVYSIFMFLCALVGIDQKKAHAIKSKLKK